MRKMDKALLRRARIAALERGITLRELVERALIAELGQFPANRAQSPQDVLTKLDAVAPPGNIGKLSLPTLDARQTLAKP